MVLYIGAALAGVGDVSQHLISLLWMVNVFWFAAFAAFRLLALVA